MNTKCLIMHLETIHSDDLRTRPLASLASVLLSCVAGSILTNLLLGIPVAAAFKSETYLLMIIASWAGVFFCPQVCVTTQIRATSECTQIVTKYMG